MHVVITGASSGIGEALAHAFAMKGCSLTLIARRTDRLESLARSLSVKTHIVTRDLTQLDTAADWLDEATAALGPVDVLINNAGVQVIAPMDQVDVLAGERSLVLNLFAPLRLIRAVLPSMVARTSGTIVNIASLAGLAPVPGMAYYNASKAGLSGASEALRGELRDTGVKVVTVYPGIIPTDMGSAGLEKYASAKAVKLQPQGTVDGLAQRVVRATEKGSARVIYPSVYTVTRHLPGPTRWFIDRFSPELSE